MSSASGLTWYQSWCRSVWSSLKNMGWMRRASSASLDRTTLSNSSETPLMQEKGPPSPGKTPTPQSYFHWDLSDSIFDIYVYVCVVYETGLFLLLRSSYKVVYSSGQTTSKDQKVVVNHLKLSLMGGKCMKVGKSLLYKEKMSYVTQSNNSISFFSEKARTDEIDEELWEISVCSELKAIPHPVLAGTQEDGFITTSQATLTEHC